MYYTKKNSLKIQSLLLEAPSALPSTLITDDVLLVSSSPSIDSTRGTSTLSLEEEQKPASKVQKKIKEPEIDLTPLTIPHFYPDIPELEEIPLRPKKKGKKKNSTTKQLLLEALTNSKKQIEEKSKKKGKKRGRNAPKTPHLTKRQRKEIEHKRTIDLTKFIPQKSDKPAHSTQIQGQQESTSNTPASSLSKPIIRSNIPVLNESDPFPFTTLSEWLIWHSHFPELAFVREAYDLDNVPTDSDEIYWINVMNEPEFFNSNWKMAGSIIHDINQAKMQGPPSGTPDFDMDHVLTEGFSTLFTDIYLILTKMPQGLKNQRNPVLQLALKGLLLLDLVFIDQNKWYAKESEEELDRRVKELDNFILQQNDIEIYERNVHELLKLGEWRNGVICFDLLITKSIYLSTFSQTHLTEDLKLTNLLENQIQVEIILALEKVRSMDQLKVRGLSSKLRVNA